MVNISPLEEEHIIQKTQELVFALENNKLQGISSFLQDMPPGELAQIIHNLSPTLRETLITHFWESFDGNVLTFLDTAVQEELVLCIPPEALAKMVHNLESDDAFSLLDNLPDALKADVLEALSRHQRKLFEKIQTFPKASAARIMQQEVVAVPFTWSVEEARRYLTTYEKTPHSFYHIFLIDKKWHLQGSITLATLLKESPDKKLKHLCERETYALAAHEEQETIALHFRRYALISAPVVDTQGRLLGVITADDVMNVVDQEAEEDIMYLGGVAASDFYAPVLSTTLARFQWLLITFFNTLLASGVIAQFQVVLEKKVALAILMPIVAAMGGNAGTQVVTVMVRAIATHDLNLLNMGRTLGKATVVSLLNGILFAFLLAVITALWFHDAHLGFVLGSALLINMLWAGIGGTLLPILVHRAGLDPALSAGPILTTTTDVLGFAIFLGFAKMFLF